MYKLCVALAFLAVAAAKPNWPLAYSSYPGLSPVYSPGYPAYGGYGSQAYSSYPVVAKTIAASVPAPAVASTYAFSGPSVVKPLPAAVPYSASFAPNYASPYAALPFAVGASPLVHPGYAGYTPFAWKK